MLTRCPACSTTFRAAPDLLKLKSGQVRCGQCAQVFNALDHLFPEDSGNAESATTIFPQPLLPATDLHIPTENPAGAISQPSPLQTVSDTTSEIPAFLIKNRRAALDDYESNLPPHWLIKPKLRNHRRALMLAASIVLGLTSIVQTAFIFRTELALMLPQFKPQMEALCAELGCTLPLPKNPELLVIETSDLQADSAHANVLILNATLKNRAPYQQQYPLLELTLTSDTDQTLARRTLTAAEYLEPGINRSAGFTPNSEVIIRSFIDSSQIKAIGYRLFLFYP